MKDYSKSTDKQSLKDAIEVCNRNRKLRMDSSPVEIGIYNAFTQAKRTLRGDLQDFRLRPWALIKSWLKR